LYDLYVMRTTIKHVIIALSCERLLDKIVALSSCVIQAYHIIQITQSLFLSFFFNELVTVLKNVASTLKTLFICNFLMISFLTGKLAYKKKGFGGAMMFMFKCYGCCITEVDYKSSQLAQNSRRQIVSLALSLAFSINGHGYVSYGKPHRRGLGLGVTSEKPFLEVINLALPHIKDMLDERCDDAKHQMKQLSSDQIGSWSRAVTCRDGCWLIRENFSQNCTFVIPNYIKGALLYYGHLSMQGADRICDKDLWEGTAKSAEGHLSQKLWPQAKEEGMKVAINWQGLGIHCPGRCYVEIMWLGKWEEDGRNQSNVNLQEKRQMIALKKIDFLTQNNVDVKR